MDKSCEKLWTSVLIAAFEDAMNVYSSDVETTRARRLLTRPNQDLKEICSYLDRCEKRIISSARKMLMSLDPESYKIYKYYRGIVYENKYEWSWEKFDFSLTQKETKLEKDAILVKSSLKVHRKRKKKFEVKKQQAFKNILNEFT